MTSENPENPIGSEKSEPNAERKSAEQTDNPKPQVTPRAAQPQATPPKDHCEITCKTKRDWVDIATLCLEAFGLFVLVVYAIATIAIWCANEKAANAAKDAAVAAKSSADTAKKSLHTTQRAYIDIKTPDLNVIKDAQGKLFGIGVRFEWENSGFTRAPYMLEHISIAKLPYALPKKFGFKDGCEPDEDCSNRQGVLPAHQSAGPFLKPITASELDLMIAKKLHVYCYGWNAYRDVFYPDTKTHLTEFCTEFGFTNPVQYADGHPVVLAIPCKVHNCADEDCADYQEKTK